jgi:hypothetical protein
VPYLRGPPVPSPLAHPIGLLSWDEFRNFKANSGPLPYPLKLLGWDGLRAKGIKDSKVTVYRKLKHDPPLFPRPVYHGKFPSWPEHEIGWFIEWLMAQRDETPGNGRARR